MAELKFKGNPINTSGNMPKVGQLAPNFELVKNDLSRVKLSDYAGKYVILNIFPSIDTGVCAMSVRKFNQDAANLPNTKVVCISKDLPFAHSRFCGAEGIENLDMLSSFDENQFELNYQLTMMDGALKGLFARSIVVVNPSGEIVHTELVDDIVHEPNYETAMNAVK
jgi:thiol peroxidase